MTIFIPRSKTDLYRKSNIVSINSIDTKYCPATLVKKCMKAAAISFQSNLTLFRPFPLRNVVSLEPIIPTTGASTVAEQSFMAPFGCYVLRTVCFLQQIN